MSNLKKIAFPLLALLAGLALGWHLKPSGAHTNNPKPAQDAQASKDGGQLWTCSMHPQIKQSEPGSCPICGMDLIPMTDGASDNPLVFKMTEEAIKLANIQTTVIGETGKGSTDGLKLFGKIQADETQASSLVAHLPGRIEKLFVSFTGEQVAEGQEIATIYSPELITAQRELLEAQKLADVSPGLLEAAKSKLRYWKISEHTIDRLLDTGKTQEYFGIYADHAGTVKQRRVSVGDHVGEGQALFEIQNLDKLWVLFDVYEQDLPKISLESSVEFETPSLPNKTFKSKISFINPVIDPETRVATARAEIGNIGQRLKPEMFVNGMLKGKASGTGKLLVPKTAVLWTGERSVVYVKTPNADIPSFEYREVALGTATSKGYTIESGLQAGDEVVTNGAFVIDASAQLNNQSSMMNGLVTRANGGHAHTPDFSQSTPQAFKQQLGAAAESYLLLKDALVASEAGTAKLQAEALLQSLGKIDMHLVKGEAHEYWMQQHQALETHAGGLSKLPDLERQRQQFDFISQAMINSLKAFGAAGHTYYVQFCPMAFDDNGASWLSDTTGIKNPYFGEKMLQCGLTQDTLSETAGHNHN